MAKLNSLFTRFLSNINPDEDAVKYAMEAHWPVRECLGQDEIFKEYFVNTFLYGSYKRHTATGTIKDVDIVVVTNFDPNNKEHNPHRVLRKLKAALARCYGSADYLEYQRRSIRVDQPLPDHSDVEMTLDIIPAVVVNGEDLPLLVPDREQKEWIWSHPKGHLRYTSDLNRANYSQQQYVPLVKMMKWWWKYQCDDRQLEVERPKPKGFWIECLTGENFDPNQQEWADHFITTLENILAKYIDVEEVPQLKDPGLPGELIKNSMTLDEFNEFMDTVADSWVTAKAARETEDQLASSKLWRQVFGDNFPLYDEEETEETITEAKRLPLGSYKHAAELPWHENRSKRYKVHLDAYLYQDNYKLGGINSNGRIILNGMDIEYVARTNVKGSYQVYWQVVNTGSHAEQENGLRGIFFQGKLRNGKISSNELINWESTKYSGKHWIECFIVKGETCMARSGRFYVNIKNPNFGG